VDAGGYRFVGPDNGVLTPALTEGGATRVVELRARQYMRAHVSRTFEGRDRFAPAAGWLARGKALEEFGPPVPDPAICTLPSVRPTPDGLDGEVVRIDRFGNLITNIEEQALRQIGTAVLVEIRGHHPRLVRTYSDVSPGDVCALVGSSGHLEIAQNIGNASEALNAGRGTIVRLSRTR
jgi:S-adenosylmethionine hydrolase